MNNDYSNTTTIRGHPAYLISYLRRPDPNGMIDLYSPPLNDPVLRLFSSQIGLLTTIGINPRDIGPEPYYTSFYALYQNSTRKVNRAGQPYKDVIELVQSTADNLPTDLLQEILDELRDIRDYLFNHSNPTRGRQHPPLLSPETAGRDPEPVDIENTRQELIRIVGPQVYINCRRALAKEHPTQKMTDSWESFLEALQPNVIPESVDTDQLIDTCYLIDDTWHPGLPWWPMILALAFYVKRRATDEPDRAGLCASGIYLSIPGEFVEKTS